MAYRVEEEVPSRIDVEEWVVRSRTSQGLPEKVDDPTTIARVAALLGEQDDDGEVAVS